MEEKQEAPKEEAKELITKEEISKPEEKVEIPSSLSEWKPKTELGKQVLSGKITDIGYVLGEGLKISEHEIVDFLLPNVRVELIFIGGSAGKGGGIRRTPTRRTARMHKSGRRYNISALVVVGNGDGYLGMGFASGASNQQREVIQKATNKAKLNIVPIRRGCGSWECACKEQHSIPLAISGKSGSVTIELKPAPKGIRLCTSDEVKKILSLGGIKDVWSKTRGQTQSRINLAIATMNALSKINKFKTHPIFEGNVGMKSGRS